MYLFFKFFISLLALSGTQSTIIEATYLPTVPALDD
jgi:hypothetical protein